MLRWHLLRWRGWQLALHKICRSDDDRALHDHVGDNITLVLRGVYLEVLHENQPRKYRGGVTRFAFRKAETPHRIEVPFGPVWTLWLRWPPRRQWGFHCPKGWRHWKDFVAEADIYKSGTSTIGKGCD